MPKYLPPALERNFPGLKRGQYKKTSEPTVEYNCIAYAAGDQLKWWEPGGFEPHHYWPDGVPEDTDFTTLVTLFKSLGYAPCVSGKVERGFEKVALYSHHSNGTYAHAAKQLPSGKWSSKLGDCDDIQHDTLESLEYKFGRPAYGLVTQIMKRKNRKSA